MAKLYWDTIPLTNKLKTIKKNTKKWIPPYYLNRQQEVAITRCKIGHSFTTHSFLVIKNPPPICDECHVNFLVQHIVLDCTKFRDNLEIPLNMEESLNKINISKIITFLTKINLINKF